MEIFGMGSLHHQNSQICKTSACWMSLWISVFFMNIFFVMFVLVFVVIVAFPAANSDWNKFMPITYRSVYGSTLWLISSLPSLILSILYYVFSLLLWFYKYKTKNLVICLPLSHNRESSISLNAMRLFRLNTKRLLFSFRSL